MAERVLLTGNDALPGGPRIGHRALCQAHAADQHHQTDPACTAHLPPRDSIVSRNPSSVIGQMAEGPTQGRVESHTR